jgi:signal peptidase I
MHPRLKAFLFPDLTPRFFLRVCLVALASLLFFNYVCLPFRIRGQSMDPTYQDGGFNFCWRPRYAFSPPKRGDVVTVRLAGQRVMLLKRVVALEGQTVEFRGGRLVVDGREVLEPYLDGLCLWNLPPRTVRPGYVYLVGDNRTMPLENHDFGQTPTSRILGGPLW